MRLPELLLVIACGVLLPVTCAFAEAAEDRGAQEQTEPYHQHHDRRHGHNHVYPDRGSIVREMPHGAAIVNYAGVSYRFYEGVWFEPRGPAFTVVTPPIGLIVPSVPAFATVVDADGEPYLYANDVYYRARPDLGGYEVVNDPLDTASKAATAKSPSPDRPVASGAAATGATAAATTLAATAAATRATAEPAAASQRAAALQAAAASQSAAAPPPLPSTQTPPPQPLPPPPPPSAGATVPQPMTQPVSQPPPQYATQAAPTAGPPAPMLAPPPPAPIPVPAPPPQPAVAAQSVLAAGAAGGKVYAVPRSAKSQDEQARDHYDCYRFAVAQSGFDPMRTNAPSAVPAGEAEFERAQAACFEARGYAVR